MTTGFVSALIRSSILQVLSMAAPILIIGMIVGLIISIFQATTSIQDQTLTFVPKILAILGTVAFLGPWMLNSIQNFTINLFELIPRMVG